MAATIDSGNDSDADCLDGQPPRISRKRHTQSVRDNCRCNYWLGSGWFFCPGPAAVHALGVIGCCVVFYIRSAYLADPTLFMLTGVMILMMFNGGGDAEGAFLYGLDRTYMTVFGVVVYTLVGVFVFPPQVEQNLRQLADELGNIQSRLFSVISQTTVEKPHSFKFWL